MFKTITFAASGAVLPWLAAQVPVESMPQWVLPLLSAVAPVLTMLIVMYVRVRARKLRARAELDKAWARAALTDGDTTNDAAGYAALERAVDAEAEADALESELRRRGHATGTPVATPAAVLDIIAATAKKPPGAQ